KLIGEKPSGRAQEFKATFSVPYTPGTLKAVGIRGGKPVAESILTTAGKTVGLRLTADRTELNADGEDLSFVTVEAVDAEGRIQTTADQDVRFSLTGPGSIAAVGNGDGQDGDSYQGDHRKLFQGRAQVVIRTSKAVGPINLSADSSGLAHSTLTVHSRPTDSRFELQ
ncbi:MAG: DUF4982 domain-containing protein, partial [Granulicella sp.]